MDLELIQVTVISGDDSDGFLTNAPGSFIELAESHYKTLWDIFRLEEMDPEDYGDALDSYKELLDKSREDGTYALAKQHTSLSVSAIIDYLENKGYKIFHPEEVVIHV